MPTIKAFNFQILPSEEQKNLIHQTFITSAWVYNWALDLKIKDFEEKVKSLKEPTEEERLKVIESIRDGTIIAPPGIKNIILGTNTEPKKPKKVKDPEAEAEKRKAKEERDEQKLSSWISRHLYPQKYLSIYDIQKFLPPLKKEISALSDEEKLQRKYGELCLPLVPAGSIIYALNDLDDGFNNFFKRLKQGAKPGFPKFKASKLKKTYSDQFPKDSLGCIDFGTTRTAMRLVDFPEGKRTIEKSFQVSQRIKLPKIGWVNCMMYRPVEGRPVSFTVTRTKTNEYRISILCNIESEAKPVEVKDNPTILAFDKGTRKLTLSNGKVIDIGGVYAKKEKQLADLNRALAKKQKGSKDFERIRLHIAKINKKITNIRKAQVHDISNYMLNEADIIVTEGFDAAKLIEGSYNAKNLTDATWGLLDQVLTYKANWRVKQFIKLDKFAATNKTCSYCQKENDQIKFWWIKWNCSACGKENKKGVDSVKNIVLNYTNKSSGN